MHARPQFAGLARFVVLALCLAPSALITWQFRDIPQLGSSHDDGIYWTTAHSLATRHEYRIESLPGEPWQTKYPPLYPAYLSLAWLANPSFPSNLSIAALLMWLCLPMFIAGAWRFYRIAGFGDKQALGLAAVTALLPQSIFSANLLMADLFGAAILLWSCNRAETNPGIAGLLAGIAYLARTAAMPLLLAIPMYYMIRRRLSSALVFFAASLPIVAGWHIWCASRRSQGLDEVTLYYTNYLRYQLQAVPLTRLPEHVWTNIGQILSSISLVLAIDPGPSLPLSLIQPLILAACVSGIIRLVRSNHRVLPYALFALLYLMMLAFWYYTPTGRFLIPILPILLAGMWVELSHLAKLVRESWRSAPAASVVVASAMAGLAVLFGSTLVKEYRIGGPAVFAAEREQRDLLAPAYDWVRENTPRDASFFAVNDPVLYLNTGRHAVRRGEMSDLFVQQTSGTLRPSDGLLRFVRQQKLTHMLITANDFEPARSELPLDLTNTGLKVVFRGASAVILEVES
jgi:hypothetical protein